MIARALQGIGLVWAWALVACAVAESRTVIGEQLARIRRRLELPVVDARYLDQGFTPPPGARLERILDRHAYRVVPVWLWWIRRAYRWQVDLQGRGIIWCIDHGLVELEEGGFFRDARPRGWHRTTMELRQFGRALACLATDHRYQATPLYRGKTRDGIPWGYVATLEVWIANLDRLHGGEAELECVHRCRRCGVDVPTGALVLLRSMRSPLPAGEIQVDDCALESYLPELHSPPLPP